MSLRLIVQRVSFGKPTGGLKNAGRGGSHLLDMATKLQTLLGQLAQITAQLSEVLGMEPSQIVMDSSILRFELAYEQMSTQQVLTGL